MTASNPETGWPIAEAKARFSDLVSHAVQDGPQTVTRRGRRTVVVVAADEWDRKTSRRGSLAEFFAESPLRGSGLELERSDEPGREIDL